jgi:hypothetical protein
MYSKTVISTLQKKFQALPETVNGYPEARGSLTFMLKVRR